MAGFFIRILVLFEKGLRVSGNQAAKIIKKLIQYFLVGLKVVLF
jgi:hypothetical protein